MLKKTLILIAVSVLINLTGCTSETRNKQSDIEYRKLSVNEYRDKLQAGWLGQIVGVAWAAPTEFRWQDKIIPENDMPVWKPELINSAFHQDDLYVEMTFLRTEEHGLMYPSDKQE